eukprot:gene15958-biopygen2205
MHWRGSRHTDTPGMGRSAAQSMLGNCAGPPPRSADSARPGRQRIYAGKRVRAFGSRFPEPRTRTPPARLGADALLRLRVLRARDGGTL